MGIKFSIIVPVYGVEDYLPQCIESVLNQSYDDFELVLVDDGSKDGCGMLCDKYAKFDSRIIVLHKQNGGLVSARIAGVNVATGDYSMCLDGDDWLGSKYLQSFEKIASIYKPDIICAGYTKAFTDHETKIEIPLEEGLMNRETMKKIVFPFLIHDKYANYFPPSVWAKAYKTEVYKKYQCIVDPLISIGEDFACTIPLISNSNSIYILSNNEYHYRQNNTSMTKTKKPIDWLCPLQINQHIRDNVDFSLGDFEEQLNRKTLHSLYNVVSSQFYREGSSAEIRKEILSYLTREPYYSIIKNASFAIPSKALIMKILLQYRLLGFIRYLAKR